MVVKITNKSENFYRYMGKFFGSRLVERQTNDRIYDDDDKEWYIFLEKEKNMAFVSISNNKMKNVYTIKEKYLIDILNAIKSEQDILYSIVPNCYTEIYKKCGFQVNEHSNYKHFVSVCSEKTQK